MFETMQPHLYSILAGDGGLSMSMSWTMSPMATCLLVSSIIIMTSDHNLLE